MSESYTTQGIIHSIGQTTEYGNNGFTKREFVVLLSGEGESSDYPNHVGFELIKDKCALMDGYAVGSSVKIAFNLGGRLWSGNGKPEKCFVSLQAWKVEVINTTQGEPLPHQQNQPSQQQYQPPHDDGMDEAIPF